MADPVLTPELLASYRALVEAITAEPPPVVVVRREVADE